MQTTASAVPNLIATRVPFDVVLSDSEEVEQERIDLCLEEIRIVHDALARKAKLEAHFEISDLVDKQVLLLREYVAPLILKHCKENFYLFTETPLTLETVTTFLFQLDYYSTFNTSPNQVKRDAAFEQNDRAFYRPNWLLSDRHFGALQKCLGLRQSMNAFVAPYSVSPLISALHSAMIGTFASMFKGVERVDMTLDDDGNSAKGKNFTLRTGVPVTKNDKKKSALGYHRDLGLSRFLRVILYVCIETKNDPGSTDRALASLCESLGVGDDLSKLHGACF